MPLGSLADSPIAARFASRARRRAEDLSHCKVPRCGQVDELTISSWQGTTGRRPGRWSRPSPLGSSGPRRSENNAVAPTRPGEDGWRWVAGAVHRSACWRLLLLVEQEHGPFNLLLWLQVSVFRRARRCWGASSRTLLARWMISPRLRGFGPRWLPVCAPAWLGERGRKPASPIGWLCLSCAPWCNRGRRSESGSSAKHASRSTTPQSLSSSRSWLLELRSFLACSLLQRSFLDRPGGESRRVHDAR